MWTDMTHDMTLTLGIIKKANRKMNPQHRTDVYLFLYYCILKIQSPFTIQSVSCASFDNPKVYKATSAAYKVKFTLITITKELK